MTYMSAPDILAVVTSTVFSNWHLGFWLTGLYLDPNPAERAVTSGSSRRRAAPCTDTGDITQLLADSGHR